MCSSEAVCFLRVHLFELQLEVSEKSDSSNERYVRSVSAQKVGEQCEQPRILCSHLPLSLAMWNVGSMKLKWQVWELTVDFVAALCSHALLPSSCCAAAWDHSQCPSGWMESWGDFGPGGSRTSLCASCRHPKSLPPQPSGKRCLELSGRPPELQLLWGDPHRRARGWGHGRFYQTCLENCCDASEGFLTF